MNLIKIKIFISLVFVFFLLLISLEKIYAEENRYIVGYKNNIIAEEVANNFKIDLSKVKRIGNSNNFAIRTNSSIGGPDANIEEIKFFEPDYQYQINLAPNDPKFSSQWALSQISAPSAWNITTGSSQLKIAILDTGVDGTHEDLSGKVGAGHDFVNNVDIAANADSDDHGHGTLVSGVAAANTNNSIGIAALDWNTKIIPVKVMNAFGIGYASDIAAGTQYAVDVSATSINLSLGGEYPSTAIEDAITYAQTHNVVVVAAAGNEGGAISYPAKYGYVLAVGASDSSDNRASWSNFGPELDVMAPGVGVESTNYSGGYSTVSGTSIAAPYVTALVSLMKAKYSSFSAAQINSAIISYPDKVAGMEGNNYTNYYGYGRINATNTLVPPAYNSASSYQYQITGQNGYPTLSPGQSYNFNLSIKNTGTSAWYKYRVNLGTDRVADRTPGFIRGDQVSGNPSGWSYENRIYMQEDVVVPGQNANFSFWYTIPSGMSPGTYREYFRPVADGIAWMQDDGICWDIIVKSLADSYQYQVAGQNGHPTLHPGDSYNFNLNITNTGNTTWTKYVLNLAPDRPQDRITGFIREDVWNHNPSGWSYFNRIYMQENAVSPGQTANFSFWMTVPQGMSPGTYREYFRPVADGITWLEDYGIYWEIKVE